MMANEISPFKNEPFTDWSNEENRNRMRKALQRVKGELGKSYPLIIGDKEEHTAGTITSVNPANYREIVGTVAKGTHESAEKALKVASQARESWRKVPCQRRAKYLFKAAELMRAKRFEWNAWLVFEAGKNWKEANADVAEAIDFLEYYGRQALLLDKPQLTEAQIPGETDTCFYTPRGITAVLGIWNFPCAINVGMSAASIVAGNATIFKPASLTPVIGYQIVKTFREAGLPDGVISYLPGPGEEVGEYLVKSPEVDTIVLTGSREAGLRIDELAGAHPSRYGVKRRILETGGKNAIIVDSDADLDEAIKGTLISWLGFGGQKCSACSRLIIMKDIHDVFVGRLIEAAESITIGDPQESGTFLGPLISEDAVEKVKRYIEIGKKEGKLLLRREVSKELTDKGYFIGPAIFDSVSPEARIAQEEIFGPILAVISAESFAHTLEIANSTGYALTGGVYSRRPEYIKEVVRGFDVGNLYINRGITGAFVGRQPFGGHRGSGTGPKAGGADYLKAFMNPRIVSENTVRRGFAPTRKEEDELVASQLH